MTFLKFVFLVAVASLGWKAVAETPPFEPLVWEAPEQTNIAHIGDVSTHFTFNVRNISGSEVVIDDVKPSCGCTAAELPSQPWRIGPKETSKFGALVDLRGKSGMLYKTIEVLSTNAYKKLTLAIDIQPGTNIMSSKMQDRIWGQELAATDHQAVFKKTCVQCHLVPAFGKSGPKLYQVACGICHEAKPRATMVPDLHALNTPIETNYWWNWVAHGKVGTLMPGFAATEGGPLDDADIDSLVKYLTKEFPRPVKSAAAEKGDYKN